MKDGLNISDDGTKLWYKDNHLHREDGPAIDNSNINMWYINGLPHRVDGPAITWHTGEKWWYVNGKYIACQSQEEFERIMRLKAFW